MRKQTGRQALAVIALGILLAQAACTPKNTATPANGGSTTPSLRAPSSTPSADIRATAAQKALDAYRGMWKAYQDAGTIPDPNNAALSQFATGNALKVLMDGLTSVRERGLVVKGEIAVSPRVTSVSPADKPTAIEVVDCADTSKSLLYRRSGELFNSAPGGRRMVTASVMDTGTGVWKVTTFAAREVGTC